jgi:hypothetical protein
MRVGDAATVAAERAFADRHAIAGDWRQGHGHAFCLHPHGAIRRRDDEAAVHGFFDFGELNVEAVGRSFPI